MNLAFIQGIGPLELVIVLAILLLVLGPKRLPGLGRSLGSGMKEFKASITSRHEDDDHAEARQGEPAPALDRPVGARVTMGDAPRPEGEGVRERR